MAGRRTPQYLAVLKNFEKLRTALKETDGAEESLLTIFKSQGWLGALAKTKADELLTKALNKIENKAESYEVFIQMLQDVSGIEDAVEEIISALRLLWFTVWMLICNPGSEAVPDN